MTRMTSMRTLKRSTPADNRPTTKVATRLSGCNVCYEPIAPGDSIALLAANRWAHADCVVS